MSKKWKIVGIEFSHMHMGDLLRCVENHPDAEITANARAPWTKN